MNIFDRGMYLALLLLVAGIVGCSTSQAVPNTPDVDAGDATASAQATETAAREPVDSFHEAFNSHAIDDAPNFATEDWNQINPAGNWLRGRDAVVDDFRVAHTTTLRAVEITVEETSFRFVAPDVAVVTTTSRLHPLAAPDSIRSTFVVVKRNAQWLQMQRHVTSIATGSTDSGGDNVAGVLVDRGTAPVSERDREHGVRGAVESFYAASNAHSFDSAAEFTTEDFNYIDPEGSWFRSRDAALETLRLVHSSFLSNVTFTIEDMSVRFATVDVAVVTVTQSNSPFTRPNGDVHAQQRVQATFVVAMHGDRWLLTQAQLTRVAGT